MLTSKRKKKVVLRFMESDDSTILMTGLSHCLHLTALFGEL